MKKDIGLTYNIDKQTKKSEEIVKMVVMWTIGFVLIYLAIKKEYEPALLLPMGFGAILVNLPNTGVLNQYMPGIGEVHGIIQWLFEVGISSSKKK